VICQKCGCTMPCECTGYSSSETCQRCGCTQPCPCTGYTPTERDWGDHYADEEPEPHFGDSSDLE
jgi:hypothetical protein